jgi:hypothetical protein
MLLNLNISEALKGRRMLMIGIKSREQKGWSKSFGSSRKEDGKLENSRLRFCLSPAPSPATEDRTVTSPRYLWKQPQSFWGFDTDICAAAWAV